MPNAEEPDTRLNIVEPNRKKQKSTPLNQFHNSIGSCMTKTAIKRSASSSTRIPRYTGTHTSVSPDAMTWADA